MYVRGILLIEYRLKSMNLHCHTVITQTQRVGLTGFCYASVGLTVHIPCFIQNSIIVLKSPFLECLTIMGERGVESFSGYFGFLNIIGISMYIGISQYKVRPHLATLFESLFTFLYNTTLAPSLMFIYVHSISYFLHYLNLRMVIQHYLEG